MNVDLSQTGLSADVLARLREIFASSPGVEAVVLFGSRATGTARKNSDIDLALKGAGLTSRDLALIANRLDDLLLPYQIDLALYSRLQNPALRDQVDRTGVELYSREITPDPPPLR